MDKDVEDDEELINSLEKYMRHQRLVDWPVTFEENIELSSFISYSSSEDIYIFFKENVPFPDNIHTSFSNDIEELWSKIKQHESTMSQVQRKEAKLLVYSNKYHEYVERARRILNEKSKIVSRSLEIRDYDYPGFDEVEVTGIPGHPDALLHLDFVSEAQGFNPGFLKIWRPFFLSGLSVAVLRDTFWWFFLHRFKPSAEEENKLFDRIAKAFVSLFNTVQRDLKDKLFMVYADCLAQAVYTAFYGAFPESMQQLNSDFKRHLADCISFWVSGVKPNLLSWQNWNLDWLSSQGTGEIKGESTWDLQEVFDEVVSNIRKLNVATPLSSSARGGRMATPLPSSTRGGSVEEADVKKKESNFVGPGPEFQHVPFKLCGPSPLMMRYLQLHSIPVPPACDTRRIQRTEISSLPPSHPTYLEVVKEVEDRSHRLHQEYKMNFKKTKRELADIQKERTLHTQEAKWFMKEVLSNPVEVKIASEGIMSKWDRPPYKQRLRKGEGAGGRTEEDRNQEDRNQEDRNQEDRNQEDSESAGQ
ncbi:protein FAM227B-like isoform X1 [Hypomesus transpacificus]|uniref:protein FAM227B-like isoform X1 n=1 Tax=Hypomesus transpacificus TaxID=137520 RepID=UPI001F086455|nr:protein FAM227B-like isoform X1 [Hypomesus transpacificus]